MVNSTSNIYQMKREILSFSNKISKKLPKSERKFIADRLSRHLAKGTSKDVLKAYLAQVKNGVLISRSSISMTAML